MAFALLTHTAKGSTASNTVTTTAIDTTGATVIVLALGSGSVPVTSDLSDSVGNTNFLFVPAKTVGSDDLLMAFIFNPTTNAAHTFTYTLSSSFPSLAVACFSGSVGGAQASSTGTSSATTTVQTGSLTPNAANGLLVSGYTNSLSSGAPTFSIDSGFTKTDQIVGAATPTAIALAYLIQTSAAAVNPTWTSTTSTSAIAQLVAINLAGGTVTPTTGYGFAG